MFAQNQRYATAERFVLTTFGGLVIYSLTLAADKKYAALVWPKGFFFKVPLKRLKFSLLCGLAFAAFKLLSCLFLLHLNQLNNRMIQWKLYKTRLCMGFVQAIFETSCRHPRIMVLAAEKLQRIAKNPEPT